MPNMPKPEPFASPKIKKASLTRTADHGRLLLRNGLLLNPNKASVRSATDSAQSILAMIKKLPSDMIKKIFQGLESAGPADLDMLGKKKYPGE
jgi:hypothetical protein